MVIDQFLEQKINITYPDGYQHSQAHNGIKARMQAAKLYVLEQEVAYMAAKVAYGKPSSVLQALQFIKLPYDSIVIDFSNQHSREAMAALGSPNLPGPNAKTKLLRSAFLLSREADKLKIEYVSVQEAFDQILIDLSPALGSFDLGGFDRDGKSRYDIPPEDIAAVYDQPAMVFDDQGSRDFVKAHLKLVASNPSEQAAMLQLTQRFDFELHPDLYRVAANLSQMQSPASVAATTEMQAAELYRLFTMQVLPALILLNCKNAVRLKPSEDFSKLNKKRLAKGKAPLSSYETLSMDLRSSAERHGRQQAPGEPTQGAARQGAIVTGHFKVRSTGVYWWSWHKREGSGALKPTILKA